MILSGVSVRPAGSDGYWPPVGTRVSWTATQPINDLMEQDLRYSEFNNLGVIGNVDHLKKHGGHTPWRPGAQRGKVYAKDTACPPGFLAWLLKKCKSDYDTMWMSFFNCDNGQYDPAGNYLGWSGDNHFHCEVANGSENKRVTLFDDFIKETGDDMSALAETRIAEIHKLMMSGERLNDPQTAGGGVPIAYFPRKINEITNALTAANTKLDKLPAAVREAVAAMKIDLTEEQLTKLIKGVSDRVNAPRSGTWSTNPEA